MNQPPDCFLSLQEVAEITGLRETTICNGECGTNELLRIKLGARVVFSENDVRAWMMQQARKALKTREWQENAVREYLTRIGKARLRGGKKIVKDAIQTIANGGFEYESEIEEDGQA
jgi:predicted DNA-binding transcriptional regulator AlpA